MDVLKLYKDFNIHIASPGERHAVTGWVNTPCPLCRGNPGNHLGFCTDSTNKYFGAFVCHRCGGHPAREVIAKLLKISEAQAEQIIHQYGGRTAQPRQRKPAIIVSPVRTIELPPRTQPLLEVSGAVRYLTKKRGFDVNELVAKWDITATGPLSILTYKTKAGTEKRIDLSYRIVIPIYYQGKIVSWQCRDWTGKSSLKYITCPPELEAKFHKHILYGLDQAEGFDSVVLVEGATDAWAWGPGGLASLGIKWMLEQIRLLKRFKRVGLLYDPEPQAQKQALKVMLELRQYGTKVIRLKGKSGRDPGSMTKDEINQLKKKLEGKS